MRFKQHALLVLLVLISACASSDSGLTTMEKGGGSAGAGLSLGGKFSCLLKLNWDLLGSVLSIAYVLYVLRLHQKDEGWGGTVLSGSANAIIFLAYVGTGGYCRFGAYPMAIALVASTMIHKNLAENSRTYSTLVPIVDLGIALYIIQNPSLLSNPYSYFFFVVAPALLWTASRMTARWGADKLSNADWSEIKKGFSASFVKGLKKLKGGVNTLKKGIPRGKGMEGKIEANLANKDVEVEKKLTVILGHLSAELVVEARIVTLLKNRIEIMKRRIKGYAGCISACVKYSADVLSSIKEEPHDIRKQKSIERLHEVIPVVRSKVEEDLNNQKKQVEYLTKSDEKSQKATRKSKTFLSEVEIEEKRLQKVEDSFKKTEKFEIKVLEEEISTKKKEARELQEKIKKASPAVKKSLETVHQKTEKRIKELEAGKAQMGEEIKKLNELEKKVHKVLKGAKKDIAKIKSFEKREQKLQQDIKEMDLMIKKNVEKQEEALKSIKDYEPSISPTESPEVISVEIMSRFGNAFVNIEDTSKVFAKESELYPLYLAELWHELENISRIIKRNDYVLQAQEHHDKCWGALNAILTSFQEDRKPGKFKEDYSQKLDEFIKKVDESYESDRAGFATDTAELQKSMETVKTLASETKDLPKNFNEMVAYLTQGRESFLTNMHDILSLLLSEDEQKIEEFKKSTLDYRSKMSSEENRLNRSYKYQNVKKFAKNPLKSTFGVWERFKARRKLKNMKEEKPPEA